MTHSKGKFSLILLMAFAFVGCDKKTPDADAPKPTEKKATASLQVLTTIGMAADLVGEVGGDCVTVEALMGPGVDPHLYRASAGDVTRLQKADLVVYGGHHLEGKLVEILAGIGKTKPTLALLESVPEANLRSPKEYEGLYDPHVWMDVALWASTISAVTEKLGTLRSACAAQISARSDTHRAELLALDAWVRASVETIPQAQRVLVTAHDAFGYFGAAYGIDVVGIQGISTASEASLGDIERVAQVIVERKLPAIFVESSVSPRTIEAVRSAVTASGQTLAIGEPLFSDALGEAGTPEGTYIGMLRANTTHIVSALGGTVAPWPEALNAWKARWKKP